MPEFQRDFWGAEEAHDAALRHYGIKQSGMPDMVEAPKDPTVPSSLTDLSEGTGMPIPKRKAVANGTSATRGRSTSPAARGGNSNGVPKRKPVGNPDLPTGSRSPRTQSPATEIRKIYRKDGKFDPAAISNSRDGNPAAVYTPPSSPMQTPAKPAAPTLSRPELKRTDSNASTSSWRVRRDSVTKLARRMSDAFKDMASIVTMDKYERQGYVREKQVAENKLRTSSPSPSVSQVDSFLDTNRVSYGQSVRSSKVSSQRSGESEFPSKPRPAHLSRGETFAVGVSKAIDPLKPRRRGTDESEMSFGMTDLAPPGTMQECSSCSQPTFGYLKNGLCKDCDALAAKVAKKTRSQEDIGALFTDPWQFPQGRATWPDVQSPEHGYMKLAGRKKILRIRQTIYEDPGNPFADDSEPDDMSQGSAIPDHKPLPPPPPISEESSRGEECFDLERTERGSGSLAPLTRRNSSALLRLRAHRRSNSVAVPLSSPSSGIDEYVAPRTLWRKASIPAIQPPQQLESVGENARDTKFYGFYDELLHDYKGRESRLNTMKM